ncbi:hypothetical protein J8281_17085 [Aquimarina sp. U1-2]|uniref:DUF6913 domain-containing protein n=1 Tax=Aquimarina sp. U1-2 TaxID=2823141 RepID=UPI001AECF649|nr:hypothetical protein [Aquimarina sp. U1-2]MBP2833914.1 hypothetical protein [Aquimarina sp. U1-2]
MILKGLKRNAIQKSIESHLEGRKISSVSISTLHTLAIIIDASYEINRSSLIRFAEDLGVSKDRLHILGYKGDNELEDDAYILHYNDKSFGVKGMVKSSSLLDFLKRDYDVLINFYEEDKLELNYVAAASKAKFKVGFSKVDHRINDLIIGASVHNPNLFMKELKKYLKILQVL